MKKKTVALLLALVLVFGVAAGGTLAWLTAQTDPVTNTFTTSDISVKLEESPNLDLKMIPGWTIKKDPEAWVEAGSEDCYLFVKLEKSANFDTFMTYGVANGWTKLDSASGTYVEVYYKVFDSKDNANGNVMGTKYSVLANDQVTVKSSVTKANMNDLTEATYPTLTVTAYASQLYKSNNDKFTPAEAWANAQPTVTP